MNGNTRLRSINIGSFFMADIESKQCCTIPLSSNSYFQLCIVAQTLCVSILGKQQVTISFTLQLNISAECRSGSYMITMNRPNDNECFSSAKTKEQIQLENRNLRTLSSKSASSFSSWSVVTWVMRAKFFTSPQASPSGVSQGQSMPHWKQRETF